MSVLKDCASYLPIRATGGEKIVRFLASVIDNVKISITIP